MRAVTLVELALLVALSWPWTRLVLDRKHRLARRAPAPFAALASLLAVAVAAAVLLAAYAPSALHATTAAATLVGAAGWWRARPSYGRSRRLPPGPLSLTRSIEAVVDRGFYAAEALRHGPVFKMMQFHRPVVCVVGLERGHDLLRRHRESLGPSPQPWDSELRGGFLRYMDDATHEVYGALFRSALQRRVIAAAEPATRHAARRELGALAVACAAAPASGVAPNAALDRIVLVAFASALFGIDQESPAWSALAARHCDLRAQSLTGSLTARSRTALSELRELVERASAELGAGAPEGGARCALGELGRAAPEMPDGVCVDNLLFIVKISSCDVSALLRWLLKMLGDHPEWSDRLRAEVDAARAAPDQSAAQANDDGESEARAPSLADRIVMEALRLEQSEYIYRLVRRDFEHDGFAYPAGWLLRLCVKESHRSEEIWSDAESFDPDRFLRQAFPRSQYSPFGFGQHACNGVDLNNMICRVMLEELAAFDWHISRDGELERYFRHWSHWRPSSRLRISLAPRAAPAARSREESPPRWACAAPPTR